MNLDYAFTVTSALALVTNYKTGVTTTVMKSDPKYDRFLALIKQGKYDAAEDLANAKAKLTSFTLRSKNGGMEVRINDGLAFYKFNSERDEYPLDNAVIKRILQMMDEGFDHQPMVEFLQNLLQNPSRKAITELYLFLEKNNLPITEDGHFIAYKMVKADYMDIYTGTMRNKVGDIPSMPRGEVDDNRDNTCSRGLHFCSKDYLPAYGSSNQSTDRCMLVKINPRDVVSIPSDYNNAKGRACKYQVVGEVTGEWRKTLPKKDFTDKAVVKADASAAKPSRMGDADFKWAENHEVWGEFNFDVKLQRWRSNLSGLIVSRNVVAGETAVSATELDLLEAYAREEAYA